MTQLFLFVLPYKYAIISVLFAYIINKKSSWMKPISPENPLFQKSGNVLPFIKLHSICSCWESWKHDNKVFWSCAHGLFHTTLGFKGGRGGVREALQTLYMLMIRKVFVYHSLKAPCEFPSRQKTEYKWKGNDWTLFELRGLKILWRGKTSMTWWFK